MVWTMVAKSARRRTITTPTKNHSRCGVATDGASQSKTCFGGCDSRRVCRLGLATAGF